MNIDPRIKELEAIYNPFDLEKMDLSDYIGEKVYASNSLISFSNLSNTVYGTLERIDLLLGQPFVVGRENYSFFIPESDLKEEVQWECQKTLNRSQFNALKNEIKNYCEKLSKLMSYTTKDTSFKIEFSSKLSIHFEPSPCFNAEFGKITIKRREHMDASYSIYDFKIENDLYKFDTPFSTLSINLYSNITDALTDYMFKENFCLKKTLF